MFDLAIWVGLVVGLVVCLGSCGLCGVGIIYFCRVWVWSGYLDGLISGTFLG